MYEYGGVDEKLVYLILIFHFLIIEHDSDSFVFSAGLFLGLQAGAQTLTMPPEIQKAYANGTRSLSGKPGNNYWQNHGRYTISLTVMPPDNTIKGVEQITYFNNSPDTLRNLNMKLIVNVHRSGRTCGGGS